MEASMSGTFNALMLEEKDGKVIPSIQSLPLDRLPPGEVTVRIAYSSLNYKDGMIVSGLGRMVRDYPHIPGIDFVGEVTESSSPSYKAGDQVILTGWRVGEAFWGGFSQMARVKADWLVPLPKGLTPKRAMAIGTAGFTAMLAIMLLEDHGMTTTSKGEVLVTGAVGGVGSVAVSVLANLGYKVAASTGRPEQATYLKELGATSIVDRAELAAQAKRPLDAERWAGAVDSVGGTTLANLITCLRHGGSVAACGLAGGTESTVNLLPFLLRGTNILGVDSVWCPYERRVKAWDRLVAELPVDKLDNMTSIAPLAELPNLAKTILRGTVRGRTVIDVNA
jgi:acrylyl-CoA reductase (NADPH)